MASTIPKCDCLSFCLAESLIGASLLLSLLLSVCFSLFISLSPSLSFSLSLSPRIAPDHCQVVARQYAKKEKYIHTTAIATKKRQYVSLSDLDVTNRSKNKQT